MISFDGRRNNSFYQQVRPRRALGSVGIFIKLTGRSDPLLNIPATIFRFIDLNASSNLIMINSKSKILNSTSPDFESSIPNASDYSVPNRLGRCDQSCESCGALHWKDEATLLDRLKRTKSYSACCQKNKVDLPDFDDSAPKYPTRLRRLLTGKHEGMIL
jgi:hypothetical protein